MTDVTPHRRTHRFWRRLFALPNIVAVLVGIAAFWAVVQSYQTNRGALIAAAVGGVVTAAVWLIWDRIAGLRPVAKLVGVPSVGAIPSTPGSPAPTLVAPDSPASTAYHRAAARLEASTRGRVLLVAGMGSGQGATTAALNLAVAATRTGRRTLLVDGDIASARLSHFGRSGISPGLTEIASGDATVAAAARLWTIDERSRLPFIPAGTPLGADVQLSRRAVTEALDDITTAADLVLIDAGDLAQSSIDALGTLADGTLMVMPKAAHRSTVEALTQRLDEAGAPAIGYVVNEAAPSPPSAHQHPVFRSLKRAVATSLLVLVAYGAFNGVQLWQSWTSVERHRVDIAAASEFLPLPEGGVPDEGLPQEAATAMTAVPSPDGDYLAVLVIGTDLSGSLADVITLLIIPSTEDPPSIVSIPRDLYVPNRCSGRLDKINSNMAGCGTSVDGPTQTALAVQDFTGIKIDHLAIFDFEGFAEIIDAVGGYEICLDYPVRDSKAHLDLPAGCTQATGEQTLSWVRSRSTQELVDGRWRTMSRVSDLTRNQRQQEVILDMLGKLGDFQSPQDLTNTVRSLTSAFALDDQLGLAAAVNLAWDLRDMQPSDIVRLEIPVADDRTASGALVLINTVPFDQVLAEVYPDLAPTRTN